MNKCRFCLFLWNKSILHLDRVELNWLFIWYIWLRSECFNCGLYILSVLRQGNIMNFRLIPSSCFLTDEWVFCVLKKIWVFESSVSFWILDSITDWLFVSWVSSKVNKVPERVNLHASCSISINSYRLSFKGYFNVLFSPSWEHFK